MKDLTVGLIKAISPLEGLEDVITCVIENFGLDNLELTEDQQIDLVARHEMLFNALHHVRVAIRNTRDNMQPFIDGIE